MREGLNLITVPVTIDNDIPHTDTTVGFNTALEVAAEAIDRLHSTAISHHRIIIVEIMGRDSGWLTLGAGIAGGADVILIPEIPYHMEKISAAIQDRASHGKRFSLVAVSKAPFRLKMWNFSKTPGAPTCVFALRMTPPMCPPGWTRSRSGQPATPCIWPTGWKTSPACKPASPFWDIYCAAEHLQQLIACWRLSLEQPVPNLCSRVFSVSWLPNAGAELNRWRSIWLPAWSKVYRQITPGSTALAW